MYTSIDDFESLYAAIQSHAAAAAGAQTVMLLVPPELDAVCACKLLVSQLRIDFIAHRILPVSSYSDIRLACQDLPQLPDVASIILINCGGMLPVTDFLSANGPEGGDSAAVGEAQVALLPNQRVYVIESRRPLNLDNLFASEYVFVVDGDGHVERELQDERDAYVAMLGTDDEDDDGDDDNDLDEDEDVDAVDDDQDEEDHGFASDPDASPTRSRRRRKRPRTHSPSGADSDDCGNETPVDGSDADDGDDDNTPSHGGGSADAGGPKSPLFEPPPNQENKENLGAFSTATLASHLPASPDESLSRSRSRSRSRFATLDSASSASESDAEEAPVSTSLPLPASSRKRRRPGPPTSPPRRDSLARARSKRMARHRARALLFNYYGQGAWLGTSSALVVYRLVSQLGRTTPDAAWLAAIGVTAQVMTEGISLARYEAQITELDVDIAQMADAGAGGVHRAQVDWRLPLYRHWSLLQALVNARGPAARLATWTEPGISRIRYLFAKLGVPLDEYSKPWVHMDKRARGVVHTDLAREAPTVGLDPAQLQWKAVTRTTSLGSVVCAADAVEALAVIAVYPGLISGPAASIDLHAAGGSGLPASAMTMQGMLTGIGADAFYAMMDALGNDAHVTRGVEAAKLMLPEIMRVAGTLITRRAIKTLRGLRYVLARDVGDAMGALRTPWGVKQLALALGAALREVNRVDLPLVVGVLQPRAEGAREERPEEREEDEPEVYLIVGHAPAAEEGLVKRNKVGLAFQYAAADVQARVAQEWFDPSVLWIDKEDVTDFLEVLQGRLAAPE